MVESGHGRGGWKEGRKREAYVLQRTQESRREPTNWHYGTRYSSCTVTVSVPFSNRIAAPVLCVLACAHDPAEPDVRSFVLGVPPAWPFDVPRFFPPPSPSTPAPLRGPFCFCFAAKMDLSPLSRVRAANERIEAFLSVQLKAS